MKIKVSIILLCLLTTLSFGFDFGGSLEDSTLYYYSDSQTFYNADTLGLWGKTELWENTNLLVYGNCSYTYTDTPPTDKPWFFDLNYFKIENKSASLLNYTLGRFSSSDFSGYIFRSKMDGASIALNMPSFILTGNAGYTGFLFNSGSTVKMTIADQTGINYDWIAQDFAAPRIVGSLQAFFPGLFLDQDLKTEVWTQFDMRKESDLITGKKLDTQYYGLTLSGPLVSSLYYDSFAYFETGQAHSGIGADYTVLSFMGSAGLRYYIEKFLYSKISFRFLYSLGDADFTSSFTEGNTAGDSTTFVPVSRKSLALVFSPELGNIFFTSLSYSLKPLSNMRNRALKKVQLELTDFNFFRSCKGLISESGINSSSTSLYLGTEIDGTVNYRPFSDLGVSLSSGVFIPNNGTDGAFDTSKSVEFLARLGVSFSF